MSFRANSFARLAKKHGISMVAIPVDPYDLVDPESLKESKHFAVTLTVGDRTNSLALVFPEYRTELPPIEDVLEYIANEATVYEYFGSNAEAFARFTKQPVDAAAAELQDLAFIVPNYKWLLGPAYYELLRITEDRR